MSNKKLPPPHFKYIKIPSKSEKEIEQLKKEWLADPCWDIYDTEGFEPHKEELREFQKQQEAVWEEERVSRESQTDDKAQKLGLAGLYRLIQKHEELLDRHSKAIESLADGNTLKAYRILQGIEE